MKNIISTGRHSLFVKRADGKIEQHYANQNGLIVTPSFVETSQALKAEARSMVEPGLLKHIEKLIAAKEQK